MYEPHEIVAAYQKIPQLLERNISLYVVATGAGAGIQDALWRVPGCSSFFRGASFPYHPEESSEFAGTTPESYASADFAFDLAAAAYMRAIGKDPTREPVGLAITASVTSNREHRGEHRAHIVCMTKEHAFTRTITLEKGRPGGRHLDGRDVDGHSLHVLMGALGLGPQSARNDEWARKRFFENPVFLPNGKRSKELLDAAQPLFPGAFNPPHEGHLKIAEEIRGRNGSLNKEPAFMICAKPPHKEELSIQEMLRRAKMLKGHTVLFTDGAALYIEKARTWPGHYIVIGADALIRMVDPKWGPDPKAMLTEFKKLGTRFYVVGRKMDGSLVTNVQAYHAVCRATGMTELQLAPMMIWVPGQWDISSSDLRARADGAPV